MQSAMQELAPAPCLNRHREYEPSQAGLHEYQAEREGRAFPEPEELMNVQQNVLGNSAVFRVSGAHTLRDAGALRASVDQALQRGARHIVIDLEGVSELGAAGVGELLSIRASVRRATGQLTLSALPGRIRYLLAVAGLDTVFAAVDRATRRVRVLDRDRQTRLHRAGPVRKRSARDDDYRCR